MAMTFEGSYKRAVSSTFPGAVGYLTIDIYGRPVYGVRFSNGHRVEEHSESALAKAADLYYQATTRLTGEPP